MSQLSVIVLPVLDAALQEQAVLQPRVHGDVQAVPVGFCLPKSDAFFTTLLAATIAVLVVEAADGLPRGRQTVVARSGPRR